MVLQNAWRLEKFREQSCATRAALAPPGTPLSAAKRQAAKRATEQRKMLGNSPHPEIK